MSKIIITVIIALFIGVGLLNNKIALVDSSTTVNSQAITPSPLVINGQATNANQNTSIQKNTNHLQPIQVTQASTIAQTIARIKESNNRTPLHDSIINDHENFKRYPEGNSAITDAEHDPVLQRYAVDERTTMSKDKSAGLTIWSDKKFYLKTDTVLVSAYIQDTEGKKLSANFDATLLDTRQQNLAKLTFAKGDNNTYETRINLADFKSTQLKAGIYKVLINNKQYELTDALTFTLTQPDIELTGEFKEYIDSQGQLVIESQVLVGSSNQYYMQGSLYSETQVAIGVAQSSTQLTPGLHWLTLSFSGLMIKDAQENGPYVLKHVSLAKVTIPMMRTPLIEPAFSTNSYRLDEFGN
ncbi:MAG: hypothetical protein JXR16_04560 [Bermanella sp.]